MSSFAIEKLRVFAVAQAVNIKCVFGNPSHRVPRSDYRAMVDANGIVHVSFPYLVLSCGPEAQVSVQVIRKDGGPSRGFQENHCRAMDHTRQRSSKTKRGTVRPPPLPVINDVPGSGSNLAQEPPHS